jgi:hypothetical protein
LITDEDIKELWQKIRKVQERVTREVVNPKLATALLNLIYNARAYLLGKAYSKADRVLSEVIQRLDFQEKVTVGSRRIAPWLLVYELAWLVGLGIALWALMFNETFAAVASSLNFASINVLQLMNSLAWGGLGGVSGALYALWTHVADQQDFDGQFSMWYIINPVLGVALGAFVFLVIEAGFISLTAGAVAGESIRSAAVIYVLAWICGFKQNVVYEIVRRILDVFRVTPPETKSEEK